MRACQPELAIACAVYMQPRWWTYWPTNTVSFIWIWIWSRVYCRRKWWEYIQTLNPWICGGYVRLILVAKSCMHKW